MADDIVTRLRDVGFCGVAAQQEAADEIERLRAAGDALAEALDEAVTWECCADGFYGPCDCPPSARSPSCGAEALSAWKEARRG